MITSAMLPPEARHFLSLLLHQIESLTMDNRCLENENLQTEEKRAYAAEHATNLEEEKRDLINQNLKLEMELRIARRDAHLLMNFRNMAHEDLEELRCDHAREMTVAGGDKEECYDDKYDVYYQ